MPDAILVGRERRDGSDVQHTWDECQEYFCRDVDEHLVVYPVMEGDRIEKIVINMDSRVLASYRAEYPNADESRLRVMDSRYIASMYLHTLLLGGGMAARSYKVKQPDQTSTDPEPEDVDVADFISTLFSDGYAEFLMRFGLDKVLETLEDE